MLGKRWILAAQVAVAAVGFALGGERSLAQEQPFDVVIMHGHIVDGTGSPWYSGDVGIRGWTHRRHRRADRARRRSGRSTRRGRWLRRGSSTCWGSRS